MISEVEKDAIELLKNIENNTWSTKYIMSSDSKNATIILNLLQTQNKMIELMARSLLVKEIGTTHCGYDREYICDKSNQDYRDIKCLECIIEYFRNKAKESE